MQQSVKRDADRGNRIQEAITLRRRHKLTALAFELGVDESALTRWRQGGSISLDNAARLCALLDVSLDWMLLGRASPEHHKAPPPGDRGDGLVRLLRRAPPGTEDMLAGLLTLLLPEAAG